MIVLTQGVSVDSKSVSKICRSKTCIQNLYLKYVSKICIQNLYLKSVSKICRTKICIQNLYPKSVDPKFVDLVDIMSVDLMCNVCRSKSCKSNVACVFCSSAERRIIGICLSLFVQKLINL